MKMLSIKVLLIICLITNNITSLHCIVLYCKNLHILKYIILAELNFFYSVNFDFSMTRSNCFKNCFKKVYVFPLRWKDFPYHTQSQFTVKLKLFVFYTCYKTDHAILVKYTTREWKKSKQSSIHRSLDHVSLIKLQAVRTINFWNNYEFTLLIGSHY